jgi:hypothetical protein
MPARHKSDAEFNHLKASFTRGLYRARQTLLVEDYNERISLLSDHQRLELAKAIQQEFSRLSCRPRVKRDNDTFQTLINQLFEAQRLVTPIHRLPVEILTEIFQLVLTSGQPLSGLMPVCRKWHGVISEMAYVWPICKFVLETWTELGPAPRKAWRLDVIIDTDGNAGTRDPSRDSYDEKYSALINAATHASRWRSLTVNSLPKGDQSGDLSSRGLFTTPMNRLEHLKLSLQSESSPFFNHLLQNIASAAATTLEVLEANSVRALQYLIQSPSLSLFHSLTTFKAKFQEMSGPVDLLPHFTRLEVLELTNLLIPSCHHTYPLPFVHNLRQLRLSNVSVQWMGGRILPRLKNCNISALPRDNTLILDCHLPACTDLQFSGRNIRSLVEMFRVPGLESLMLTSNEWTPSRGSQPVIDVCMAGLGRLIRPRILHIALLCDDMVLLSALKLLPDLEELNLELPRPSALGRLLAKPPNTSIDQINGNSQHQGIEQTRWYAITCPSLKVFQLRYRRWLRESDQLDALPSLLAIGQSRARTPFPLKAFSLHLMASNGVWQVFELEHPAPQFLTLLRIPQFSSLPNDDWYHRGLFKAFLTSNTLSTLDLSFCNGATIDLMKPLFQPNFRHLRSLTICQTTGGPLFTVLPSFRRLEELYLVRCSIDRHDMDLPLVDTLQTLFITYSSVLWMDGRVFTKLKTVIFDWPRWPKSFSQKVDMPSCSYIKISSSLNGLISLQSNFHFPVLDIFEMEEPWLLEEHFGWDSPKRAIDALQMIQARALQFSFAADPQELLQLLEARDEVEELAVRLYGDESVIEGFLIGLRATAGKPVCPNLKILGLQLCLEGPLRGDIIKWCKGTLINRRHAGHPLRRCSIRRSGSHWESEAPLNLIMLNDGRMSIEGEVSEFVMIPHQCITYQTSFQDRKLCHTGIDM